MACFVVPAAEAIVVTAVYAAVKIKEKKAVTVSPLTEKKEITSSDEGIKWSRRLSWLMALLWGGVALLAFEHFWHGEIQPFFPFLTAMATPEDAAEMLHEMATVGVGMAVLVTAAWGVICAFAQLKLRALRAKKAESEE